MDEEELPPPARSPSPEGREFYIRYLWNVLRQAKDFTISITPEPEAPGAPNADESSSALPVHKTRIVIEVIR